MFIDSPTNIESVFEILLISESIADWSIEASVDISSSSILYSPDSILFKIVLFITSVEDVSGTPNKLWPEYSDCFKDNFLFK